MQASLCLSNGVGRKPTCIAILCTSWSSVVVEQDRRLGGVIMDKVVFVYK
jgi:hypothetical protein